MDGYTSLLNLSFMSAWRTGNSLVDMIIAMIIPILSNWVATFFSRTWPNLLRKLWELQEHLSNEVKIQHGITDRYHHALDITEGSILQEAIELYVDRYERPFYRVGEFLYSNVGARNGAAQEKNLRQILQKEFKLICRPSHESVEVSKDVFMCVKDSEDKKEEGNDNKEGNQNNDNDNNARGKVGKKQTKMREMIFVDKTIKNGSDDKDRIFSFVRDAFEWYKKEVQHPSNSQRYLFHPSKASNNEGRGLLNDGDLMSVSRYPLFDTKSFNSLFFPEKEKLIALIDQFETKTGKFAVPGFPHRLTLLLHGPPGTGKTSLVKAIAQRTGRHILSIPLSQVRTNRELIACMHDQRFELENSQRVSRITLRADKVIYLLEDADATSDIMLASKDRIKKKNVKSNYAIQDALSVKGILEAFGGILDAPKRIIIMTTNHMDRLDTAISRLGFITMRLHMGNLSKEDAARMVEHYFGNADATPERIETLKQVMDGVVAQGIQFSPSELEQLCAEFDTIDDLIGAIKKGSTQNMF